MVETLSFFLEPRNRESTIHGPDPCAICFCKLIFVEFSHCCWLMCHLWFTLCYNIRIEQLWQRPHNLKSLKIYHLVIYRKCLLILVKGNRMKIKSVKLERDRINLYLNISLHVQYKKWLRKSRIKGHRGHFSLRSQIRSDVGLE